MLEVSSYQKSPPLFYPNAEKLDKFIGLQNLMLRSFLKRLSITEKALLLLLLTSPWHVFYAT